MTQHAGYHEPVDLLDPATMDRHRAIVSLMEELEAVDWYDQRVSATSDASLAAVLAHNRDEEMEHAAMILEWLRRRVPEWDAVLRTYLFAEGPITAIEEVAEHEDDGAATHDEVPHGEVRIGDLKGAAPR
jgi:hypothetical protein